MAKRKPKQDLAQTVEELVRKRVDEIMGSANLGRFLEPDMRSRGLATATMGRQTVWDRRKHALYYERFGCRVCARKDVPHRSNGHCERCFMRLRHRYEALQKQWEAEHPIEKPLGVDPEVEAVKRLIGKLGE